MTTTTSYGTWTNHYGRGLSPTVEQTVEDAFGDWGSKGYDFDAIVSEYRAAINNALPQNVNLCGDEFIGPYYAEDQDFDGYPMDGADCLDIRAIIDSVELWPIVERHELPEATS